MTRRSQRLLFVAFAFVVRAVAQQDFTMDPGSGSLIVKGRPDLSQIDDTKLKQTRPKPLYAQVYHYDGVISKSCPLQDDWHVQLGNAAYVDVLLGKIPSESGAPYLIATSKQGTWSEFTPNEPRYFGFKLKGYDVPDYYFKVTDRDGNEKCPDLTDPKNDLSAAYLRITDTPDTATGTEGSDDPPIPMVGGSLRLWAPKDKKFTCDGQSATLDVSNPVVRVESPDQPYVILEGISDWRITAYPQQLEIKPSWWSNTLKFSVPATSTLDCGAGTGKYLTVSSANGAKTKPLQFVVDWSPGWFRARRYLQAPCGECRLLLRTAKKK